MEYLNRLINEKSPYLLQHANHPVNWYPWCEEAFEKARREKKLIFLSIGYSTCHWCHVMAQESFEDEEIADILNQYFVAMKVDKEERPDIDAVYMEVCQSMTGHGGWPLTILMTSEQKPVFAGTYFPKYQKYGQIGLVEILEAFYTGWEKNPEKIQAESERISACLYQNRNERRENTALEKEFFKKAVKQYEALYDKENGGFGSSPKFPSPHNLLFLLRYARLENSEQVSEMAYHTLSCMYRGGIFDHAGGGFSRYSTDEKWLVPHFEKMLYDNALLAYVYLEAFQMSERHMFREAAERILQYVLRELTNPQGGFYCAQDADSEGEEGRYYVFTRRELLELLGEERGEIYCKWYGVTEEGNFEGRNILHLIENKEYESINPQIATMNREVEAYRRERMKLHKDDKVLTAWNGLMIAAFAKAYQVLGEKQYLNAAKRAERFVEKKLTEDSGRLKIRYREEENVGNGQLQDYAFMAWAEYELYKTGLEVEYLKKMIDLSKWMVKLFYDSETGGFYFYASDGEQLISRPKEIYDGAMPSGNGMAAYILVQLSHLTGEIFWSSHAERQLCFLSREVHEFPTGHGMSLTAMLSSLYAHRELVCVAEDEEQFADVLHLLRKRESKNLTVIGKTPENAEQLAELCPYTSDYPIERAGVVYYICQDGACMPKVQSFGKLQGLLAEE